MNTKGNNQITKPHVIWLSWISGFMQPAIFTFLIFNMINDGEKAENALEIESLGYILKALSVVTAVASIFLNRYFFSEDSLVKKLATEFQGNADITDESLIDFLKKYVLSSFSKYLICLGCAQSSFIFGFVYGNITRQIDSTYFFFSVGILAYLFLCPPTNSRYELAVSTYKNEQV